MTQRDQKKHSKNSEKIQEMQSKDLRVQRYARVEESSDMAPKDQKGNQYRQEDCWEEALTKPKRSWGKRTSIEERTKAQRPQKKYKEQQTWENHTTQGKTAACRDPSGIPNYNGANQCRRNGSNGGPQSRD